MKLTKIIALVWVLFTGVACEFFEPDDSNVVMLGTSDLACGGPGKLSIGCDDPDCQEEQLASNGMCIASEWLDVSDRADFTVLTQSNEEIWPGNVVFAQDALELGELNPIAVNDLSPTTLSVSLMGSGPLKTRVDQPSLSNYRAAINDLLNGFEHEPVPANLSFQCMDVYSAEHLALHADVSIGGAFADFSSQLYSTESSQKRRVFCNFEQIFFTVDMDPFAAPENHFLSGLPEQLLAVEPSQLRCGVSLEENPRKAVYVKSVKYGRRAILSIETTRTWAETQADMEVRSLGFGGGGGIGTGSSSSRYEIKTYVAGGNATAGAGIVDIESFRDFVERGAEFSHESEYAIVGYTLSYLDNRRASVIASTQYKSKDCRQRGRVEASLWVRQIAGDDGVDRDNNQKPGQWYGRAELASAPGDTPEDPRPDDWCSQDKIPDGELIFERSQSDFARENEFPNTNVTYPFDAALGTDNPLCLRICLEEKDSNSFSHDDLGCEYVEIEWEKGLSPSGQVFRMQDGDDAVAEIRLKLNLIAPE